MFLLVNNGFAIAFLDEEIISRSPTPRMVVDFSSSDSDDSGAGAAYHFAQFVENL